MKHRNLVILSLLVVVAMILGACGSKPAPTTPPAVPTTAPVAPTTPPKAPPLGLPAPLDGKSWDDILAEAKGQTVNFWHWGGSDLWNAFYAGYIAKEAAKLGVTIKTVPVAAPTQFVDTILNESKAGVAKGSVDIVWINGENFRTVKQAGTLYGPYADKLPNAKYCDWNSPAYTYDFGTPIEGMESVWLGGQMVVIYNTACAKDLPVNDGVVKLEDLEKWIIANPGKFTHTSPPEFTATAFLTALFYKLTGGAAQWQGPFNQTLFDQKAPLLWDWLNKLEPYFWRKGETYPESLTALDNLFANGEVCFNINYGQRYADTMIKDGRFPDTARTFVLESGTVANWNFMAIPKNSGSLAGALVVANMLMSPEVQYEVAKPDVMGSQPGITLSLLSKDWQDKFNSLPRGVATLPPTVLSAHQVPPLSGEMLPKFEQAWEDSVLKK
jgi:putative spermidine/putrescine transport system substrate-binding protein